MKRERLEPPRKTRGGFRYLSPQQRLERRLARGTAANRIPADPTVARLMRTIAQCKEQEKQAWAMLTTYLATGRTVVRLRLEDVDPQPKGREPEHHHGDDRLLEGRRGIVRKA